MQICTRLRCLPVLSLLCAAWARHLKTHTAICTSVRPAPTKDCTSGNETRTQNACASVPIHIVPYSYTVIIPCTVLYDVPINVAYETLSKYFMQVLSFVALIHITQTATRVGPNYTLHSQNYCNRLQKSSKKSTKNGIKKTKAWFRLKVIITSHEFGSGYTLH